MHLLVRYIADILGLEIDGVELGTRVFRPAIPGKRVPLPKLTAQMQRDARLAEAAESAEVTA